MQDDPIANLIYAIQQGKQSGEDFQEIPIDFDPFSPSSVLAYKANPIQDNSQPDLCFIEKMRLLSKSSLENINFSDTILQAAYINENASYYIPLDFETLFNDGFINSQGNFDFDKIITNLNNG